METHFLPERHKIPQHFTASGVVIARAHILLVHHKRIGAWLPPGGHIDPGELPHEAAAREVLEETGVEVDVLSELLPDTGNADAFFTHSPLCIHMVRAFEQGQDLYHVDLAYLCRPKGMANSYGGSGLPVKVGSGLISSVTTPARASDSAEEPANAAVIAALGETLPALKYTDEVHQARWIALDDLKNWTLAKNVMEAIELARARLNGGTKAGGTNIVK